MRFPRFGLIDDRPNGFQDLARAQADLLAEVRRAAELHRRLELWMDMSVQHMHDRDHARASLAQVREDLKEAEVRIVYLEGELTDMTRSRDELSEMADCLRDDLRKAKERKRP